jgi:hypothetical protein
MLTPEQETRLYEMHQQALECENANARMNESINAELGLACSAETETRMNISTGVGENMAFGAADRIRPTLRAQATGQSNTDTFVGSTLPYNHYAQKDYEYQRVLLEQQYTGLGWKAFLLDLAFGTLACVSMMAFAFLYLMAFRPDLLKAWLQ